MISKRADGRGHRKPLSETEETVVYTVKVLKSECEALREMNAKYVRKALQRLIKWWAKQPTQEVK